MCWVPHTSITPGVPLRKVMKFDAEESRKEEGCTRFDVLQDREKPNVFHFYEVYVSAEAAALHKTLPHYKVC